MLFSEKKKKIIVTRESRSKEKKSEQRGCRKKHSVREKGTEAAPELKAPCMDLYHSIVTKGTISLRRVEKKVGRL